MPPRKDRLTNWLLTLAGTAALAAGGAAFKVWRDSAIYQRDILELRERLSGQVSAERIGRIEADVEALKREDEDHERSISALWRSRSGRESDR